MLASVGYDGNIKLWSLDSNKEFRTLKGDSKEAWVNSVSFSPDGKMLASTGNDGNIKLWSLEDNKEVWSLPVEFGPNAINLRVRFSPDGKILASVISGGFIKLLSIDGKEIRRIKGGFLNIDFFGDFSGIGSIAFSPDSKMLASVEMLSSADKGDDCIIRLLNLEGREIGRFKCQSLHINSISFSPDGKILASAGEDGIVILWNLDLDDLLRRGCDLIRDYLQNNPNVNDSDRHLCDDVPKQK